MAGHFDPERRARDDFLSAYRLDLEQGRLRPLAEYQAQQPGFESAIAEEFDLLEDEGEKPEPAPPRQRLLHEVVDVEHLTRRVAEARADHGPNARQVAGEQPIERLGIAALGGAQLLLRQGQVVGHDGGVADAQPRVPMRRGIRPCWLRNRGTLQ
jgi:hypothetical protein